jgi:hypothetical protein
MSSTVRDGKDKPSVVLRYTGHQHQLCHILQGNAIYMKFGNFNDFALSAKKAIIQIDEYDNHFMRSHPRHP